MRSIRFSGTMAGLLMFASLASADVPGTITRLSTGSTTSSQNSPAISGTQVIWTDVSAPSNFDVSLYDIATGVATSLTNTPSEQEFLTDIDAGNIVWTHAGGPIRGDIVLQTALGIRSLIASSTDTTTFQEPTIRGQYVAFLRVDPWTNVDLINFETGVSLAVTNDTAGKGRPRVGADHVVFEVYSGSGDSDIWAYPIPTGPAFLVAGGPDSQTMPDIELNKIVFVQTTAGTDQLFLFDLATGTTRQLTTVASMKILPRISGSRVVWADDRNGDLDLYLYDLATDREDRLVGGPGDQFLADIDGNRVVYTDNSSGFEEVYLFTIASTAAYSFTGFFSPVDNLPVYNLVNAGRAVPIKFSLGGDQGLGIFAAGYPSSTPITCDSNALTDGIEETVTAGASSLQYDAAAGQYVYVWKTSKDWANTCRQLVVQLRDGNYYRANFSFK